MSRTVLYWIVAVILLLPLLNLLLGIHPPRFRTDDDPARYGLSYEEVSFDTTDGLTLRGWFIPAASTGQGRPDACAAILVGHGYPFDKANILRHALFLHGRFHLLLFDFRYFGESDGWYTTAGLLETRDVDAAVGYLMQRSDVDPARIGAFGFSMSAASFILAAHPDIRAIVADSPYASLERLVARQFFFFPGPTKWPFVALTKLYARVLLGVDVTEAAPASVVQGSKTPLLIIHGKEDSQIPVEHAYRYRANIDPNRADVWIVEGADHGHAHVLTGDRYEVRVRHFFETHLCRDLGGPRGEARG